MKKNLKLLLMLITSIYLQAQVPESARNPLQEPQWSINLYFEDATGATDMLTLGYDPAAGTYLDDIDPQFGEVWETIDTSAFNMYCLKNTPPFLLPIYGAIDTNEVMKRAIISSIYPSMEFGWVHGELPITMTWDDPKLNSSALPANFIDIIGCPKARMDMWYNGSNLDTPLCINESSDPYPPPTSILTNLNCFPFSIFCIFEHSITWTTNSIYEMDYLMGSVYITVSPLQDLYWDPTMNPVLNIRSVKTNVSIRPNPVVDKLIIEQKIYSKYEVSIFSILGKEMMKNEYKGLKNEIDVSKLKQGIYFIRINNNSTKFIKL